MKIIVGTIISATLAIILPTLFGVSGVSNVVISTLFTVVGVIFSVGMSLIVSISTSSVKNKDARDVFRSQLSKIRTRFIIVFVVISFLYVLLPIEGTHVELIILQLKDVVIKLNFSNFLVCGLLLGIIYYIVNFYSIQTSVYSLEDRIDRGD